MLNTEHSAIERLLLISNDEATRKGVCAQLEAQHFTVLSVSSRQEGMASFKTFLPQVVLLDADHCTTSEFHIRGALKTQPGGADVPVIGLMDEESLFSVDRIFESGIDDVISMPFHMASFAHRLKQAAYLLKTRNSLQLTQARLVTAQRLAQLGNWEQHFNPDIFICSHEAERIIGLDPADSPYTSQDVKQRIHPDDLERIRFAYSSALKGEGKYRAEYRIIAADHTVKQVCVNGELRFDPGTHKGFISGTVQDVTERRESEQRIRHLAYYDSLTELPNKQLFKEQFEQNILLSERYGLKCALLFVDLDDFKRINDSMGHEMGDELLKMTAGRIQGSIRRSDGVSRNMNSRWMELARLGGDEFILMLPNIDNMSDAEAVAARLLDELGKPYAVGGRELVVTASIGVACYPEHGRDFSSLIKNADTAVHEAKRQGRSSYCTYQSEMTLKTLQKLHLEHELRKAIMGHQLMLMYQPQIDSTDEGMVGVEALVRWVHPKDGIISPADFIPLAEETGLVTMLGRWVLDEACRQLAEWRSTGLDSFKMSVNVSPKQLHCDSFVDHVREVLDKHQLPPTVLQLEVTESALMGDVDDIVSRLTKIKAIGVRISIDDFGTGYSSLSHLKRYPIDVLKIDRSFVMDIGQEEGEAIVNTIIGMARTLKLGLVAEGVETKEQLEFLQRQGSKIIQGYFYSPPLAATDLKSFFEDLSRKSEICEPA